MHAYIHKRNTWVREFRGSIEHRHLQLLGLVFVLQPLTECKAIRSKNKTLFVLESDNNPCLCMQFWVSSIFKLVFGGNIWRSRWIILKLCRQVKLEASYSISEMSLAILDHFSLKIIPGIISITFNECFCQYNVIMLNF